MRAYWKMVLSCALISGSLHAGICHDNLRQLVQTPVGLDGRVIKYFYTDKENRVLKFNFHDAQHRWFALQIMKNNHEVYGRDVRGYLYVWGNKERLYHFIMLFQDGLAGVHMTDLNPESML